VHSAGSDTSWAPAWRFAPLVVGSGVLLLAALALLLPGHAAAQNDPPTSPGDWFIDTQTTVASQTVVVTGNVIIANGGSLTLTSVNLRIASSYPGEFALVVRAGGTFTASGGTIMAQSAANSYRFEIFGVTSLDRVSLISDMWGSPTQDKFGIQIYNGNTSITNSTISRGQKGNILVMGGSPLIYNNTIEQASYLESSTTMNVCNGEVIYNAYGILVANNSMPVIEHNTIRNNGPGSTFPDRSQEYYDTWNAGCTWGYLSIQELVFGYGVAVRGASPEIRANTISLNSQFPSTSIYRTINTTTVSVYRYPEEPYTLRQAGAGLWLGIGGGNVTGNTIDRNYVYGVFGDGSSANFSSNNVSSHRTQTPYGLGGGVLISGGIVMRNDTLYDNLIGIVLIGSGTGVMDGGTIKNGTQFSRAVDIYYYATGTLNLYNISFSAFTSTVTFDSFQGATLNLFNCTIDPSGIDTSGATGMLAVYWPLQMRVQWPNGAPAGGAFTILTNNTGGVLYADTVGGNGESPLIWVAGYTAILAGGSTQSTVNDNLDVKIYANGTVSPLFPFHFNQTTYLVITISDPVPPSLNVFRPLSGEGFQTSTVHLTGNAFDVGSGMDRVEASADGGATWVTSTEPLPGWGIDLTFADGVYDLSVRAYDLSGTFTEVNISGIVVDTVSPSILILQPSLPATAPLLTYTTFTAVALRGNVDEDAILTLNGVALTVQGGTFSRQLILTEGANYFQLVAIDEVGNRAEVDFVLVSDTTPPAIFVSAPADNFATNRSVVLVNGVTETDVFLTLNDRTIRTTGGVFSEPYALSEGPNTVKVTATDRAGNNHTVVRTVFFDTVAPQINLTSPSPNLVTRFRDLTVTGAVESAIGTVYVNGAPVATGQGAFTRLVRLDEGRNVIVIQAWDSAGNPATLSTTVTLDTVPPQVAITSPADGALVNQVSVRVTGNCSGGTRLLLNGVALDPGSGSIDESVTLAEGRNELRLVAFDEAGNSAEAAVLVTLDTVAPQVELSLPSTPVHTQSTVYTLTGRITGATSLRVNGSLVAMNDAGEFSVSFPLALGENTIDFVATDAAGNTATVLGVVVRDQVPVAPQGLFGLGDLQYVVLPLFLAAGAAATYLIFYRRRKGPEE
jgi:parallel beta-helix repeat protein